VKKVLIIGGSPNRNGSTHDYTQFVINGLKSESADIEYINIHDFTVTDVWEGYFGNVLENDFSKAGDDDMPLLKQKMAKSDVIILSTPLYNYHVPGRLKSFIDRWTDHVNSDFSTELAGKGLAVISTHSGVILMNSSAGMQTSMKDTANFLGMSWLGAIDAPSKMPHSSGMNTGHTLIAEDFGQKLARGESLIGIAESA
jgi:multimeric flavodoxin WrbA